MRWCMQGCVVVGCTGTHWGTQGKYALEYAEQRYSGVHRAGTLWGAQGKEALGLAAARYTLGAIVCSGTDSCG